MKIVFEDSGLTQGIIKISLDGGKSFTEHEIANIKDDGFPLSDSQQLDKIRIKGPVNLLKNMEIISRIRVEGGQALSEESPRIEYCVSKTSSCCCGDSLNFSITKGGDLFTTLKESSYADFVCPEWFHIDGDRVIIDCREYDYGDDDGSTDLSYRSPDSDGVQYAPETGDWALEGLSDEEKEERYAEYDSFMSNWHMAYDMTNQEIVSILSSAKIGFQIDGMWIPMIFI